MSSVDPMAGTPGGSLKESLRELYKDQRFTGSAWQNASDHGFLATHLTERSISALASRLSGRLIDVGCGEQPYRQYFAGVQEIVACDFDAARGNVDFACPAHAIPVPPESFDSVLCTEVLEHVPDPLAVWREFFRILKPGGRVLLTTPFYWPPHELPHDYYRYPEHGLRYLAISTGFEIEAIWPRGGTWALFGQMSMHVFGHYLRTPWLRRFWNQLFLRIDRRRCNPGITLGWTILAQKSAAVS